jgi:hypothetical protein
MVTTIRELNIDWFTFCGLLSESEMLHLGGTPYILCVIYTVKLSPQPENMI